MIKWQVEGRGVDMLVRGRRIGKSARQGRDVIAALD